MSFFSLNLLIDYQISKAKYLNDDESNRWWSQDWLSALDEMKGAKVIHDHYKISTVLAAAPIKLHVVAKVQPLFFVQTHHDVKVCVVSSGKKIISLNLQGNEFASHT